MKNKNKHQSDQRGSITVLVAIILVPTIMLNSFMVDIARLKLYGNQAVMTADNYGEAVLTIYDNLLKDLYGLFAVSQSDKGKSALDELDKYISSSFNPNDNTISWGHLTPIVGTKSYSGFMPYKDAEVELKWSASSGANLGNEAVLSTQIGDFMRFRVLQTLQSGTESILDAIDDVKNTKNNAKVIEKKTTLDDTIGEVLEDMGEYYNVLKVFRSYPSYLDSVNKSRSNAVSEFGSIAGSNEYSLYKRFKENESAIRDALNHADRIEKAKAEAAKDKKKPPVTDTLSAHENELISLYIEYQSNPNAHEGALRNRFNNSINSFKASFDSNPIDFDNFNSLCSDLTSRYNKISKGFVDIESQYNALKNELQNPNITEELKKGVQSDLEKYEKVIGSNANATLDTYKKLTELISKTCKEFNEEAKKTANNNIKSFENIRDAYIACKPANQIPGYGSAVNSSRYEDFYKYPQYKKLYDGLDEIFGSNDSTAAKKAKKKKDEAKKKTDEINNSLKKPEKSEARDIPSNFSMGSNKSYKELDIVGLIKNASSYFNSSSIAESGNKFMLNLYTIVYDYEMFSNRTTNYKADNGGTGEDAEREKSLTGYELSKDINYLYKGELEYIFAGLKSADGNLNEVRNRILLFRAVMNFTATYQISEINTAIKAVSEAAMAVNPLLGIAVEAALRLAVTAMETAADWDQLKKDESVCLMKQKLGQLTSKDIGGFLGIDSSSDDKDGGIQLNYEQYLLILILLMTPPNDITRRTGDLIALNVNNVMQNGELKEEKFKMDKAITAVDAVCTVHLDFAVIPESMAGLLLDGPSYTLLEEAEKNKYSFSITRGY